MRVLAALAAIVVLLTATDSMAQVTTPLEAYIYGTGVVSGPPYPSTAYIPVAPSASGYSLQHIGANTLGLTSLQIGSGTGLTLTAPAQFFVCTATCTVTPPPPVAGYQFCVMNDDNTATVITLGALGSSAQYENSARTGYGTAGSGTMTSGGAIGDTVCLVGRDSTHYLTLRATGTWTNS